MTAGPRIIPLTEQDLPEVADVHVRVWRETYRGQMPQDFLDGLKAEKRLEGWRGIYAENKDNPRYGTLLARVENGELAGFMFYGPARDEGRDEPLELYAFNILAAHQGKGIGFRLFDEARKAFRAQGCEKTYLWVLEGNTPAIAAYRRWGGKPDFSRTKNLEINGKPLKEISVTFTCG